MEVYPLKSISLEQAQAKQFRLIDCMMAHFSGLESLTRGDLGVKKANNKPEYTLKAEAAIADFFGAEDCILVRGSGTGAIRYGLSAILNPGETLLIHDAPAYTTTQVSIDMFGIQTIRADFNDLEEIRKVMKAHPEIKAALVQISRQKKYDRYEAKEVIETIKAMADIPILTDDNYAAMKVEKVGYELGADLTTFSCFKLQGPEGIGCVVGRKSYIEKIKKMHYSGGCQVQGFEAMEVLRGLVYAPVLLAIQAQQCEAVLQNLKENPMPEVEEAIIANAQSKVLLITLKDPIAQKVLAQAEKLGALPNPVGSESKYELVPLFYKASGTFLKEDPTLIDRMLRINPNRASAETVLRILKEAIRKAGE